MPPRRPAGRRKASPVTVLRWLLVPLTAFAVWAGTLLLGLGGITLLDALCPEDLMVSGLCTASWYRPAMAALEMFCAGTAAVAFIMLPARVAPSYRVQVAIGCFALGAVLTALLAVAGALWAPAVVAGVAGSIALGALIRRPRA
jgi:hypothetical protein